MHVEFSNNPNGDQSGTGNTPDDTVIVFTYKSTVTKVDENEYALNMTYADDKVAFSDYLKELREVIREETKRKIEEAGKSV